MVIASSIAAGLSASARAAVHAASADSGVSGAVRLSDERSETRWAYPLRRARVRSAPSATARTVTRLRLLTEDHFPEVYLLLERRQDARGAAWIRVRLPMRPNGRTGWVPADALGDPNVVRTLIDVDRRRLRLTLSDRGRVVFRARIGVGKPGTITPAGRFYVREKFRVTGAPMYGTHAIGTSAYAPTLSDWPGGGVVGLHGTDQPELIPGRPSSGCIRLRNRDIARLYRLVPRGTPIRIR